MFDLLAKAKPLLKEQLHDFLSKKRLETDKVGQWSLDLIDRLEDYTCRGKMIRGALVEFGHGLFANSTQSSKDHLACLQVGVAMELFQSMLLIHDDIMDQDDQRRGQPSIHAQYRNIESIKNLSESNRLSESMGICVGDVASFFAFEVLASLDLDHQLVRKLLVFCGKELALVGIAQMNDVYHGTVAQELDKEAILSIYRYKTGRYTFSLPMICGAIIAGVSQDERQQLGKIGETIGLIFQIKDDEIGLFGASVKIGKRLGSDIVENKKTLHRLAYKVLLEQSGYLLPACFGKKDASQAELDQVLADLRQRGVAKEIDRELSQLSVLARAEIDALENVSKEKKAKLIDLLDFNISRTS